MFCMNESSLDSLSLRYEAELAPLMETVNAIYRQTLSTDVAYRNILSLPPTLLDSTPQSKRRREDDVEEEIIILAEEEVEGMTESEKKEYVGALAISVFTSYQKCYDNAKRIVNRIAQNYSVEEAETFLKEKLGCYIAKLQLDEKVGLIQRKPNKKGHQNVLLNEGVDICEYIEEIYDPLNLNALLTPDITNNTDNQIKMEKEADNANE